MIDNYYYQILSLKSTTTLKKSSSKTRTTEAQIKLNTIFTKYKNTLEEF